MTQGHRRRGRAPGASRCAPFGGTFDPPSPGSHARLRPVVRTRLTVQTMDLHCAGEPLRLITSGLPARPDAPVLERRALGPASTPTTSAGPSCYEPRGHRDMYGAVLLPPVRDDADMTVLFMHNEGYSTMCGHGIIALTTGADRGGPVPGDRAGDDDPLRGAGRHRRGHAAARRSSAMAAAAVRGVRFTNVPVLPGRPGRSPSGPMGCDLPARRRARRAQRRHRLRWRLLRHRRRGRPGPAGRARADRGADAGRRGHHRGPAPRPHAARTRPTPTWASCTARSSSTSIRHSSPDGRPPDATCAT